MTKPGLLTELYEEGSGLSRLSRAFVLFQECNP